MKLPQFAVRDLFWLVLVAALGLGWWSYRQFVLTRPALHLSVHFVYFDRQVELNVFPDQPFRARVSSQRPREDDEEQHSQQRSYCELAGVVQSRAADGTYPLQLEYIQWWDEKSNTRGSTTLNLQPGQGAGFGSNTSVIEVLLEEKW